MSDFSFTFPQKACEECNGFCCRGESGYIFVTWENIEQIANLLSLDPQTFKEQYVKKVGYKFSLIEKPLFTQAGQEWACYFFDEKTETCQIYEARPKQCRTFPFWDKFKGISLEEVKKECPHIKSL